jgi:hypothetical protein
LRKSSLIGIYSRSLFRGSGCVGRFRGQHPSTLPGSAGGGSAKRGAPGSGRLAGGPGDWVEGRGPMPRGPGGSVRYPRAARPDEERAPASMAPSARGRRGRPAGRLAVTRTCPPEGLLGFRRPEDRARRECPRSGSYSWRPIGIRPESPTAGGGARWRMPGGNRPVSSGTRSNRLDVIAIVWRDSV